MDIEIITPLTTLAYWLGILPFSPTAMKVNDIRKSLLEYIKAGTLLVIFTAGFFWVVYTRFYEKNDQTHPTMIFLYTLSDVASTLCNVFAIIIMNLYNGNSLYEFIKGAYQLESFMTNKPHEIQRAKKKFSWHFLIINVLTISLLALDGITEYIIKGFEIMKFQLIRDFQYYHAIIASLVLAQYSHLLYYRMKDLNNHLIQYVGDTKTGKTIQSANQYKYVNTLGYYVFDNNLRKSPGKKKDKITLKLITNSFTTITQLISAYGNMMGFNFILFFFLVVISLLIPVNLLLLNMRGDDGSKGQLGIGMIFICIFWIIYSCLLAFWMINACNDVSVETGRVPQLCYILIKQLNENETRLRSELEKYANHAFRLNGTLSASGFFSINFGVIFPILASILSYIIVILQFH